MEKIRAEPGKHRLDNGFMKWSQETIEANKKTGHGITDKKETFLPNTHHFWNLPGREHLHDWTA